MNKINFVETRPTMRRSHHRMWNSIPRIRLSKRWTNLMTQLGLIRETKSRPVFCQARRTDHNAPSGIKVRPLLMIMILNTRLVFNPYMNFWSGLQFRFYNRLVPRFWSRPKLSYDQTIQTEMTSDQTFQTEVTPDQTFQTKMISDQTFQTKMSSDQTETRPLSRL